MIFHLLINIHQVFNASKGTQQILMNDKSMFDCYYCINSTKAPGRPKKTWDVDERKKLGIDSADPQNCSE